MAALLRVEVGLAALGAGLIHLGVAATSGPLLLLLLLVWGGAETAWGVWALAARRIPRARLAIGGALVPVVVWAGAVVAHVPSAPPFAAMAGASALDIAVAVLVAVSLRARAATRERPLTFVLGAAVGAAVVAVIATSSLAATPLGATAEMPGMDMPNH